MQCNLEYINAKCKYIWKWSMLFSEFSPAAPGRKTQFSLRIRDFEEPQFSKFSPAARWNGGQRDLGGQVHLGHIAKALRAVDPQTMEQPCGRDPWPILGGVDDTVHETVVCD